MGKCDRKIVCHRNHDGTEFILERFERLLRKNIPEKTLQGLRAHTRERLVLRSESYGQIASAAFQTKEFLRAQELLTKAINILPSSALFAKRSLVHLTTEKYQLAAADGTCAIGLDSTFPSGYFCRALALIHLHEYEIALRDLDKLRRCLPNSKRCNQLYVRCRNQFWEKGEIEPFEAPQNINEVPVNEEESVFVAQRVNELKAELSSSGIIEASKFTEVFVIRVIETYKQGIFHLPLKLVFMVLQHALDLLKEHENVVSIDITDQQTLTVVGDLRGNFHNLMSIFNHNQSPQFGRPYLFNGNIIGDYKMSLPCIVIILCMKILFPEDVFINRGSEECLENCETNGFENEVLTVYDEEVMKGFTEVFNWLPVAHVLNNSVMIVHGGIFEKKNTTLADIQEINRWYQPPDKGPMCDILHSDPWNYGGISKADRQRGVWFGPDAAIRFCRRNCLDYIVRSHQMPNALGYEAQSYRHCITVNSSTEHATYLRISGETSTYYVVHGRKEMKIPKNCSCWIMCNCRTDKEKEDEPLNDYATLKLDLLPVPSEPSSKSMSVPSSSRSVLRSKSNIDSRVLSQPTVGQLKRVRQSMEPDSRIITAISHEPSHPSLLALLNKSLSKSETATLVRATQSSRSDGSVRVSQQSIRSTRSNRSPISNNLDPPTTTEMPYTNQPSTNGDERAPTITESDTLDKPENISTNKPENISMKNDETNDDSTKVRDQTEDITVSSYQTDSPSEVHSSRGSNGELIHQLADRSKTRSAHWLMTDHRSTHYGLTMKDQEVGGEYFELE